MNSPTPTVSLKDMRREYLEQFIDSRRYWSAAKENRNQIDVDYFWQQMCKWGSLIDITTRLQNSLKRRVK